jgi:hypothetical protein
MKKKLKKKSFIQKPDWGNPFSYSRQSFSPQIRGGKRAFSGASRKGMGAK